MSLKEQLTNDMKEAMKSHDKESLSTIRLLKSAIDLQKINNKLSIDTEEYSIYINNKVFNH